MRFVMLGISLPEIANLVAYAFKLLFEKKQVLLVTLLRDGLVLIKGIIIPVLFRSDVGHQYISSDEDGFFAAFLFNGLQGGGRGDVDIGHEDTQEGYHFKA